jgi:hypothetical protein
MPDAMSSRSRTGRSKSLNAGIEGNHTLKLFRSTTLGEGAVAHPVDWGDIASRLLAAIRYRSGAFAEILRFANFCMVCAPKRRMCRVKRDASASKRAPELRCVRAPLYCARRRKRCAQAPVCVGRSLKSCARCALHCAHIPHCSEHGWNKTVWINPADEARLRASPS